MGQEGKMLVNSDNRGSQSSHTASNLFGHFGGQNLRLTNHNGEIPITTRDKGIDQSYAADLAFTDPCLIAMDSPTIKVLHLLKDDKTYSVGIVGMGGTGKTTLAKAVGRKAKELNVIKTVVFIVVSRRKNVKRIQDEIAKGLSLTLVTGDLTARARQIFLRLQSEERTLIILDDIWLRLDLHEIGIAEHMGCKVLLTSRNMSVVKGMGCQSIYHQYLLTESDGWSLFCNRAGIDDKPANSEILEVSRRIAGLCKGLPLAYLVMGGSLRGKPVDEWMVAFNMLKKNTEISPDFSSILWRQVKFGYEVGLTSKVAKSLFLISGLFPGNGLILIEDLSHYAVTLGLCGKNEVNAALNSLIHSGLLMHDDESKDRVIMHNVLRDFPLKIIKQENPSHRDSIQRYLEELEDQDSLYDYEDFRWKEELDRLLHRMFHVRESSSSIVAYCAPDHAIVAPSYTHPEPSGKLVDFKGHCLVDESYLPLLKEVCKRYPQLIISQAKHPKASKQSAFNSLGHLLFMLHNASVSDWVYLKGELNRFWKLTLIMEFDLEWLRPMVERVLSSTEIDRIEALRKEEEKRNAEAAKLRQQLNQIEAEAACYKREIAQIESKFKVDGFAITQDSKSRLVSKVSWWKGFGKKKVNE